jgi:hypothetical protein
MTWTYNIAGTIERDRIRRLTGDTISTAPADERLEDEEIADFLATEGSYRAAAVVAARALAAKILRKATQKSVGTLTLVYQQRHAALMDVAASLERDIARGARPYAGGISVSDHDSAASNTDRVPPAFAVGMLNSPRERN